jgi:hypothetical protein
MKVVFVCFSFFGFGNRDGIGACSSCLNNFIGDPFIGKTEVPFGLMKGRINNRILDDHLFQLFCSSGILIYGIKPTSNLNYALVHLIKTGHFEIYLLFENLKNNKLFDEGRSRVFIDYVIVLLDE